ncbi:MAG: ATP-binding cassette domain-containing protein, partial [Candidatus Diapherotrites archaeon]|nr:ATP-binding cassette domain-containing protein [Candidatus Diapherotrites archaeon]
MIELNKFSLSFKQKKVIQNLNLSIGEKNKVAVVGSNGSGKTSLALFLAGVIPEFISATTSGKANFPEDISLLLQNPSNQFFAVTVSEELGCKGIALAQKLGAGHLLERNIFNLSEGEKQKINLISLLSHNPSMLLLDEPLELLDPSEGNRFSQIIKNLKNQGIVWFDKNPGNTPKFRKIFLSRQKKIVFPKKNKSRIGKQVL